MSLDEVEILACSCGTDDSGEEHESWCIYLRIKPLFGALETEIERHRKALNGCGRYAYRIDNELALNFDRDNAKGIIRIVEQTLGSVCEAYPKGDGE